MDNLNRLFNPESIAVVGASNRIGSVGNSVMKNLIGKFNGVVYPVNPKRNSVLGVRTYRSVSDIKDPLDLAVICTPAPTVPGIVEEAGKKGVGGIVIITAGFKEAGEEGMKLFDEIIRLAEKYDIRILGPNCLGFIRPKNHINASFSTKMALPGKIAFLSQSGALCTAILDWSVQYNVGFSYFVSLGSMADIGFEDMLRFLEDDEETSAVIIYMESLKNPKAFLKAATSFTRKKPIIVMKVGRSNEGAHAAMSHTGSLAGNDAVFDAAFRRAGIIRVNDSQDLYNCAQVLARQPIPSGNRLAIITNAGGPGVIATDSLIKRGGKLAELSPATLKKLDSFLPRHWSHNNPVDVLGDADPERYKKAVDLCLKDKNVDGALVILTPQSMTDPMAIAKSLIEIYKKYKKKPVFGVWMGEEDVELGRKSLEKGDIPVYRVPECGVQVFMALCTYSDLAKKKEKIPKYRLTGSYDKAKKLIHKVISDNRSSMTEEESKEMMSYYDIPVAEHHVAKTREDAVMYSKKLGYPVVMKILSPDILHKTDIGGVRVGISSDEQARLVFDEIMENASKVKGAVLKGVFIEKMYSKKYELIIGMKHDPMFGPSIVLGAGGVTVELMKDTALDIPPISKKRALEILSSTKIYKLLSGYRGMKGVNLNKLATVVENFSKMVCEHPELKEVDINPFSVDEKGGVVLDAKIILQETDKKPFEQLVLE